MAIPSHPAALFSRVENKPLVEIPQLAPGEPVPPGFEDVVKRVTQIQATLDSHKNSPLIGLEYLVELTPDERGKEPQYVCMLCDKKGDPRVAMAHITSFNHRSKYIGIHFPTANKAMFNEFPRTKDGRRGVSEIVNRICAKIEEKYGRLHPIIAERETFETNKDDIMKQIQLDRHFRETAEETFAELVDKSVMDTLAVKMDDVPQTKAEEKNGADLKSTFVKGKISCDRSRLRIRGTEENIEDDIKFVKAIEQEGKRSLSHGSKKTKLHSSDSNRKSLSSISSLSSSSHSRSPSRSRSRSHSKSRTRSRSRSYSRSCYNRHNWRDGKYSRGRWRRSRSGSRGWHRSRSGSRSRSRRSSSPGSRYGRRGSPDSRYYRHSRSPKYGRYRDNPNDERHNRFREKGDRDKTEGFDPRILEKTKWTTFRQEVDKIERDLAKELKFHEKNPEKHPMYPEEWKKFWNRRYKELQAESKDPSKHDFKPEWIEFWNKRMKEMHEESLKKKKEEQRLKLGLPKEEELVNSRPSRKSRQGQDTDVIVISPPAKEEEVVKKDVTVADIKNTWKALTGSEIKDVSKRSPSPWEEGEPSSKHSRNMSPSRRPQRGGSNSRGRGGRGNRTYGRAYLSDDVDGNGLVTVLRLLTALENQLGSLGPRVNTLLASALSLEKTSSNSSNSLLSDPDNFVLLETVREKLKGQLLAGIVERNMVMATRSCIGNLGDLLTRAEESGVASLNAKAAEPMPTATQSVKLTQASAPAVARAPSSAAEPVSVPGIGTMDKVAIAQQIAAALVAQGKTDVTQEELEQLINAVVGMAQASASSEQPISTASYVSQMQQSTGNTDPTISVRQKENPVNVKSSLEKFLTAVTSASSPSSSSGPVPAKSDKLPINALALLQSAYDDPKRSPSRSMLISNKVSNKQNVEVKNPSLFFKDRSPSPNSSKKGHGQYTNKSDNMEDLTEQDLQTLLQNFKDLSPEEQQGLISYLKKLETKEPEKVEKLRQYVNLEGHNVQKQVQNLRSNLKSSAMLPSEQSGRLSPFSLRQGGINPSQESGPQSGSLFSKKESEEQKSLKLDDSDDDYSFEDIYNAASQNIKEKEKAVEEEKMKRLTEAENAKNKPFFLKSKSDDPTVILRETKEMIANLMGQLPSKYIQKQTSSPSAGKESPSVQSNLNKLSQNIDSNSHMNVCGQGIQTVGTGLSQISQVIPSFHDSQHLHLSNSPATYSSQYGSQNYARSQQSYLGSQEANYSYPQNSGYYGGSQLQYSQNTTGNYNEGYPNSGLASGGWNHYSEQYGQQPYQRHPGPEPYSQYSNQPPNYY